MSARRIYLIIVANILGNLSGLIAMIIIARNSGADAAGDLAFWLAFVTTLGFSMSLDFDSIHLRMISIRTDQNIRASSIGTFATLKVITILISVLILFGSLLLGAHELFGQESPSSSGLSLFIVILLFSTITCLSTIFLTTFAALNETAKQQISSTSGIIIRNILLCIFGFLAISSFYLGLSYLIGSIITLFIALYFFRGYKIVKPSRQLTFDYLRLGGPLLIAPVISSLIVNIDKIFLSISWTQADVGIYFIVQSIAFSLLILGRSLRLVFIPSFSESIREGTIHKINFQAGFAVKYMNFLFIPLIFFSTLFFPPYLSLFLGSGYINSHLIFNFFFIGIWFLLLSDLIACYLIAKGSTIIILWATLAGLAVSLVSLLTLVPSSIGDINLFGLAGLGAAISFTLSSIAQFIFYRSHSKGFAGYFDISQFSRTIIASIIASALTFSVIVLSKSISIESDSIFLMISTPILFITAFLLFLFLFKGISRRDFTFIARTISPREMVRYIKGEIER